jgi:hypothetical protein
MLELTEEQRRQLLDGQAVEVAGGYVVLPKDLYDRLRAIADGATRRAGWDDPALDAYERYRKQP